MRRVAPAVVLLALALMPLSAGADASSPFQPSYDITSISNSSPGAHGDVVQRIQLPQGDHVIGSLKYTLPVGWDIALVIKGSDEPIVGSGQIQVDVGPPALPACDGVPETYPLTIFDLGRIQGDTPDVETNWVVQGYPYQQFIFIVKGSAAAGQTIESFTFTTFTPTVCTPLSLDLTFQGMSSDNPATTQNEGDRPVLTSPGASGVYTWSVEFRSKPLTEPPEHLIARCDRVGIGTTASDADADGLADGCDNCPATANADQRDANIDGLGDACDPADSDGDGFSDRIEYSVGTSPTRACGIDAWPGDTNNDGFSDISDIDAVNGSFDMAVPPAPARHSMAPDPPDGFVDILDIDRLNGFFDQVCS